MNSAGGAGERWQRTRVWQRRSSHCVRPWFALLDCCALPGCHFSSSSIGDPLEQEEPLPSPLLHRGSPPATFLHPPFALLPINVTKSTRSAAARERLPSFSLLRFRLLSCSVVWRCRLKGLHGASIRAPRGSSTHGSVSGPHGAIHARRPHGAVLSAGSAKRVRPRQMLPYMGMRYRCARILLKSKKYTRIREVNSQRFQKAVILRGFKFSILL